MGYQTLHKVNILSRNVHHETTGYLFQSRNQSYHTDPTVFTKMVSLFLMNTITTENMAISPFSPGI